MPLPNILACRNVDESVYPPQMAELVAALAPFGEGAQGARCFLCNAEVMLGPRQALSYDIDPESYIIACFMCVSTYSPPDTSITNLGGN